ncbi:hypothetical protein [Microvirga mediterraneensis]|uniref:Uncharacterized protein n=1 Tax=Microvirga mediterraneensis TaxID=2754695 RepID=A0A838BUB6_9HYPH|nr:hypothetical protein [Microvirga mediterraneensis]MBA1158672.1 hypothetical protein [Microvirga mediterraneensis]
MAAFAWAQMDERQRKAFKKSHGTDPKVIVAHAAGSLAFNYGAFTAQAGKKNFGENLSRHLATRFSAALAHAFPGILPSPDGKGHESKARTSKGYKKLDVNYSTPELGLGLGVSIKTINAIDAKSKRFTKNYTRVDAELRAEAADYHERQPYATMVAVIFLPVAACEDASEKDPSSFGAAVRLFRHRAGRHDTAHSGMLFERVFIGLYDTDPATFGETYFVDVTSPPPWSGRPRSSLSFDEVVSAIIAEYDRRNKPEFIWESAVPTEAYEEEDELTEEDSDDEEDQEGVPPAVG